MRQLMTGLATILATIVLGTTLLASGANAVPASDAASMTAIPTGVAQTVTIDGQRPEKDGDHHRRFCLKLNAVLTRLVDQGVITREQKVRILAAFGCLSVVPPTTEPPLDHPTHDDPPDRRAIGHARIGAETHPRRLFS